MEPFSESRKLQAGNFPPYLFHLLSHSVSFGWRASGPEMISTFTLPRTSMGGNSGFKKQLHCALEFFFGLGVEGVGFRHRKCTPRWLCITCFAEQIAG